jgi:uncharacterized phiE125 gp8 family phage protein
VPERLITAPTAEVVSLELAKSHLVLEHDDDDTLLEQIIAAATKHAESYLNRVVPLQTWEALFPAFPSNVSEPPLPYFELTKGHIADPATVAIEYLDEDGAEQTLDASTYLVDDVTVPGRVLLAPDEEWPSTQERWDAVRVTYEAGWDEGDVPEPIIQAILLLVSQLYEHRTPEVVGTIVSPVRFSFEALLSPFRIFHL